MKILRKLFRAIVKKFLKKKSVKHRKKSRRISRSNQKKSHFSRRKTFSRRKPVRKSKIKKKAKLFNRSKKPQKPLKPVDQGEFVGDITHYFSKIKVCVIHLTKKAVAVGDRIEIRGHTTRFIQKISSLQIENSDVKMGRKGQMIGLKVDKQCRAGDRAFKIVA